MAPRENDFGVGNSLNIAIHLGINFESNGLINTQFFCYGHLEEAIRLEVEMLKGPQWRSERFGYWRNATGCSQEIQHNGTIGKSSAASL